MESFLWGRFVSVWAHLQALDLDLRDMFHFVSSASFQLASLVFRSGGRFVLGRSGWGAFRSVRGCLSAGGRFALGAFRSVRRVPFCWGAFRSGAVSFCPGMPFCWGAFRSGGVSFCPGGAFLLGGVSLGGVSFCPKGAFLLGGVSLWGRFVLSGGAFLLGGVSLWGRFALGAFRSVRGCLSRGGRFALGAFCEGARLKSNSEFLRGNFLRNFSFRRWRVVEHAGMLDMFSRNLKHVEVTYLAGPHS